MYCERRGNGQKPTRTKPPRQNLRQQLRQNLYRERLSWIFVLSLLKIGGWAEMCDVLSGVQGCVKKCDKERGVEIGQKYNVTYFIDGPYYLFFIYVYIYIYIYLYIYIYIYIYIYS